MSRRRWSIWLGPPIVLVAVALVLSRLQPGAEAGGRAMPAAAGACSGALPNVGAAPAGAGGNAIRGTWWRLVDRLDADGTLVGRTLVAGKGGSTTMTMPLATEGSASGPVGGLVLVTSDDDRFSEIRLVSVAQGCSWLLHRDDNVVRSAVVHVAGNAILAHLVQRETRADLGVWQLTDADPDAKLVRIVEPLVPQADLGPIWSTTLRLDATGHSLAVQSCSDAGCLTRVLSLDAFGRPLTVIKGPAQGSIVGLTGSSLITWAYCVGMPCELQAWDAGSGNHTSLLKAAIGAAMTGDGRYVVAVTDANGRAFRIDLSGSALQLIQGLAAGDVPLGFGVSAYQGIEVAADEVGVAAPGADAHAFNVGKAPAAP